MILARLLLLSTLLLPPLLSAAVPVQPLGSIRDAAIAAVHSGSPSLKLSAPALDERLRLPRCELPLSARPEPQRGAQIRVAVACEAAAGWTVYVALQVSDVRPVLTLVRGAQRGEPLAPSLLQLQERDVAGLQQGFYSDLASVQGLQLRRAVAAGTVLTPGLVEAPQLVRRGDLVTIVGRAGSVEVRSEGKALRPGARGERIPVENSSSRRIVEGEINGAGEVEVRL